ncbi:MAG: flotillin family protein [Saprospiraceae bacterium]
MFYLQAQAIPWTIIIVAASVVIILGLIIMVLRFYRKIPQGKAIIATGMGGTRVAFERGIFVIPPVQMYETMDLSVKTIEIVRMKEEGLICKDNIRADIKVVFFVRINKDAVDIQKVAQSIGTQRASDLGTLRELFEAKFSEAIKTVGKRFDFVDLYDNREKFNHEIQNTIGEYLNGYKLDDVSIDYLEQTEISYLRRDNILDSEGIKKITELTAQQNVKANYIRREEEKTLREQDVEAREAILEFDRQLAEKEERQKREIANIKAREGAEILLIEEQERLRADMVRINTEQELQVAEENMQRQVLVASKNKERTNAIETERVEKDRLLEVTEREKIVTLAEIEKTRAVEEQKKSIQDVIRDRISVEKKVVEQEELIKDTRVLAEAERLRRKVVIEMTGKGEAIVVEREKAAEGERLAAEIKAKTVMIEAEAEMNAASKEAESRKIIAQAKAAEEATIGLSEAQVTEAKARARQLEGEVEAKVLELSATAEARGIEAKAGANKKQGMVDAEVTEQQGMAAAKVLEEKLSAEARGVALKADAMKKLDGVGKEHEEFKLRLEKDKEVQLAQINVERQVAEAQAKVLAEAMKHAKIDIIGGEMQFVNSILNSVGRGKQIDGMMNNSTHLRDLKDGLLGSGHANGNGNGSDILTRLRDLVKRSGLSLADVKDMTLTGLLLRLNQQLSDPADKTDVDGIRSKLEGMGMGELELKQLL